MLIDARREEEGETQQAGVSASIARSPWLRVRA